MSNLNQYKIFAFRAIDEPQLCAQYLEGHVKVLTDYGIENITSNNDFWTKNPSIYCLGLYEANKFELIGGIRIQLRDSTHPLPIEEAIGGLDNKIYNIVRYYALNGGVGELSGLWINNKLRGQGLGVYMVRAAIASANQLNFKTLIGICGDVTLDMFNNVGFVINDNVGKKGSFFYPNETLIAHVVGILNAISLESASVNDKKIMLSLRENWCQKRIEIEAKMNIEIAYNLKYPKVCNVVYRETLQTK